MRWVLLAVVAVIGLLGSSSPVYIVAAPDVALLAPVATGTTVKVIDGYNSPPPSRPGECDILKKTPDHCQNQAYGFDLDVGTTGFNILAPAPGWVHAVVPGSGGVCINYDLEDGTNLNICHFATTTVSEDPLHQQQKVSRGTVLGTSATTWVHLSLDDRYHCSCDKPNWPPLPFVSPHTLEGRSFPAADPPIENQYARTDVDQVTLISTNGVGDIGGLVKNSVSGEAVSDASVIFEGGGVTKTTTSAGGTYLFSKVPAGSATISATHPIFGMDSKPVTVLANSSTQAPDLLLSPPICPASARTDRVAVSAECPEPTPTPNTTPPDTTITSGPNACGKSTAVTFTFSGSDDNTATSDLAFAYQLDSSTWSTFSTTTSVNFTSLSDGNHTFRVKAKDQAGNEDPSPAEYSFQIDTVPPTTSVSLSGTPGNNGWYRSAVTATLSATDTGCGSTNVRTEYNINNAGLTDYTGPIAFSQEGRYTFEYRSIDGAGNIETTKITQIVELHGNFTPKIARILHF